TGQGSPLALIVCFIPRALVGITPYFTYTFLKKITGNKLDVLSLTVSGIVGSLTNTLFVMHFIFFLFKEAYAATSGVATGALYNVILGIIAANGIPEAIAAGVITAGICIPLKMAKINN
ncbi:MAG: ECF transporter S component, partial [Clostridiales bacterium]|nr:ECF transporter S component [Clostridiales bacterium]